MQLCFDAISVLGSRLGLMLDPIHQRTALMRFDKFDHVQWFGLRAGVRCAGRTLLLPLAIPRPGEQSFAFVDQRLTPCSFELIAIDPVTAIKVSFRVTSPFRPWDADFSTTPALSITLEVERLAGQFRWEKPDKSVSEVELFVDFAEAPAKIDSAGNDSIDLVFPATTSDPRVLKTGEILTEKGREIPQRDRIVALTGRLQGSEWVLPQNLSRPPEKLSLAWITWSGPALEVQGAVCPFRYTDRFTSLDSVAAWARANPYAIIENAARVDGIVLDHDCGPAVSHLLAYSLHSWLACTWWVKRPDGRDWFSVWEGSCYFHSTVDVEFTQAPFYLALWPELLEIELDFWPEFAKSGEPLLGPRGAGTLFLSHDCGIFTAANGQQYPHEMEVEETANWILMAFAHSRRTGRDAVIKKHRAILRSFIDFLIASDSTGNGVPDKGIANTIDDASPAVQFGTEQTYLAVKTLGALEVGAILARELGDGDCADRSVAQARLLRQTFEDKGWVGDHYAVLVKKSGDLVDPWTGKAQSFDAIPGWDAEHIYTPNTLPLLDMVGYDLGLSPERVAADIHSALRTCLREYGCVHSSFEAPPAEGVVGLAGSAASPGWVSMNMLRDLAGIYRGIDLVGLVERYWNWQLVTNTQEPALFFETFSGNNLKFYPRGVALWGIFDAVHGLAIDRVSGKNDRRAPLRGLKAPIFSEVDWRSSGRSDSPHSAHADADPVKT